MSALVNPFLRGPLDGTMPLWALILGALLLFSGLGIAMLSRRSFLPAAIVMLIGICVLFLIRTS